ncbi:MAG: helix-turn-helix domain-containing protein [bacterium]
MDLKSLTISQTSKMLGVSIQTLRRWDDAGKFFSVRKGITGHRYYKREDIDDYIKNNLKSLLFKLAKSWVINDLTTEFYPDFYCSDSSIFQARLSRLEKDLVNIRELGKTFPLISAITGEIGNNSFDHNLGNWPDIPGIFFAYDLSEKKIALADRGQGILATLKKVRPELANHKDALRVAFTEIVSGRAPESRGNGLKFVKNVVSSNKISLLFQTGDAKLEIKQGDLELNIEESDIEFHGCLALIKF